MDVKRSPKWFRADTRRIEFKSTSCTTAQGWSPGGPGTSDSAPSTPGAVRWPLLLNKRHSQGQHLKRGAEMYGLRGSARPRSDLRKIAAQSRPGRRRRTGRARGPAPALPSPRCRAPIPRGERTPTAAIPTRGRLAPPHAPQRECGRTSHAPQN